MAKFSRINAVDKLPPKQNAAYNQSQDAALKVARHRGKWAAVYHYTYDDDGRNSANVRAQAVKNTNRSWAKVGLFETAVRADVTDWPYKWVVYARCLERYHPDGSTEVFIPLDERQARRGRKNQTDRATPSDGTATQSAE